MANPTNNSFETWTDGDTVCSNWALYSENGGQAVISSAGSTGVYDGTYCVNIRGSGAAPIDSIGGVTSDAFALTNDFITFWKNDQDLAVAPTVRIFNSDDVELASYAISPYVGWKQYCINVASLKGQNIKIRFEQHTLAGGAGYYTLIDLVECTDTPDDCYACEDSSGNRFGEIIPSTATASGYYSSDVATQAIDNNNSTRWHQNLATDRADAWVKVDLGSIQSIGSILVRRNVTENTCTFNVDISTDDSNWTNIETDFLLTEGQEFITIDAPCRYIRISNFGGVQTYAQIFEIRTYGTSYKEITTIEELDDMRDDTYAKYILMNDLDFDSDDSYDDPTTNKAGFTTGSGWESFVCRGQFNGNGKTISNLFVDRSSTDDIGLFSYIVEYATVKNLILEDVDITGQAYTGSIAGKNYGTILKCRTSGTVVGTSQVGGFVGYTQNAGTSIGTCISCGTECNVSGTVKVGGFVGYAYGALLDLKDPIINCYAKGSVTRLSGADVNFGGFVGWFYQARIINCFSTGKVEWDSAPHPTDKGFAGGVDSSGDFLDIGNFFDTDTSSQATTAGNAKGRTTTQLKNILCYTDYDYPSASAGLAKYWSIVEQGESDFSVTEKNVVKLSGSNEISVGSADYSTNALSLSIKFKLTGDLTANSGLISWGAWNEDVSVYLRTDETSISIVSGTGARYEVTYTSGMLGGGWHHLIVTMDSTAAETKAYLDNVYLGTVTCLSGGGNFPMTNNLTFGSYISDYFDGCLSDIRIYDAVLSEANRENLFINVDVTDDLVGHWKLDEGAGGTLIDSVGSKNGSLSNEEWLREDTNYSHWEIDDESAYPVNYYVDDTVEYTASFEEQNSLDDVEISIYSDAGRTTEVSGSPITTAGGGLASLDLENGTYYYTASKLDYNDLEDSFTIADDDEEVDFTMTESWLDGWLYRKKITIPASSISSGNYTKETLTSANGSADSVYGGYVASNAFDDNAGTLWAGSTDAPPHWLMYDFGDSNEKTLQQIAITPWGDGNGYGVKDFIFQGSNNTTDGSDGDWDNLCSDQHANDATRVEYEFSNSTAYRYYRLYCSNTWRTGFSKQDITELELYSPETVTLTDFTSLVKLTDTNFDFDHAEADGTDIRFTSSDKKTLLSFEREFHGEYLSNNLADYFVKIPSVSSSADTEFYMYYGNDSAVDGEDASNTWDSYYKAIYHLKETCDGTASEIKDSTSNSYDLTGASPYLTSDEGFIYKGLTGGSNGYAKRPSTDTDLDLIGDFVLEWKMKWDSSVTACSIMGKSQGGGSAVKWVLNFKGLYSANTMNFMMGFGGSESWVRFDWVPVADTEYNCALRRDGNNWKFFVNGVQVDDTQVDSSTVLASTQSFHLFTDGEAWQYYAGLLDEVRITKGDSRSDAYITATYLADTNDLLTFGAEETEGTEYTVTFEEQNSLDGVEISIYSDSARTVEIDGSPITTAGGGTATIDLEDATYYYTASKANYGDIEDSFIVNGAVLQEDFTMLPKTTEDLYPQLEWITKESDIQLTPSLEWLTKDSIQATPSLEWLSKFEHRFCPNLINYEFDFLTPTIYTSKNTATVSGILHSLTLNMKNTGSSGSTIISLYVDNVLIQSKTITADNDEYKDIEYFDMTQLIYPKDTLEIRVTQVAVGCSDLKIGVYEMTFPFALQNAFMGNIKDSIEVVSINRAYLFNNADYWTIDFNQPLNSVSLVTATNVNGDTVTLTNEITDGDFYNSRIKITPSITSNIESISIKAKDLNNQNYSFVLYPTVTNYMSDYPSYVFGDTEEIEVFTPATYFKYSFDSGVTWSDWGTISSTNTMTIDFSAQTEGQKTLTVRYRNGSKEFEEDVDIYYVLGDIDCAINYVKSDAKLSYTDAVPLDRVEVYYDDVLSETLELDIVTGMDEIDLNTTTKKLTVNAGYIYRNNQTYYFDGTAYSINPDFASNGNNPNWRYILVFNLNTNVFEWKEEILVMESDAKEDVKYEGYMVIAIVDIVALLVTNNSVVTSWGMLTAGSYSNISNLNRLGLNLDESKVIKIRVIDVVGRTRDFSATYNLTKYNIWRELTVSRGNIFASSYDGTYYPKYIADVDGSENIWRSDTTESLPQWVRFDCGTDSKKTVKEYSLTCYYVTQPGVPKSWKLQGSNDASNWTDLHEVSNETSWTNYSSKTYTVDNTTAYAFYRLYVTAVVTGTVVNIYWLRLRETVGGDNFVEYAEEELLPGEIHQSPQLELDIDTEDWVLDDTNGVT